MKEDIKEIKELTIPQLSLYLHSLNKYDEEVVISGIISHLQKNKNADYVRLRPNGVDCAESRGNDLEQLQKNIGYKWGSEFIKIKR